jgi:PAS domain S-box-containing protein
MAKRVLIVQREPAIARALEATLTRAGYEVAGVATSAGEASAHAERTVPQLLLVDLALRDDADVMRAAVHHGSPLPVVLTGAEADVEAAERRADGDPTVAGHLATSCSVRELRATIELALCRSERGRAADELEAFFSVSLDMFCFLDFDGRFRRLNPAWERTLGFTREELMSRPFLEFVHPDDRERTLAQNASVRAGGRTLGFENRYLCKDGSFRWLYWYSIPVPTQRVIYGAARDVTARREAEDERARLVVELQASLAEVQSLREILPICSYCRRIRDDENYWQTVESYISRHTRTRFSHGICPTCMTTEVEPQLALLDDE